jgi:hypothetical protein
MGKAGTVIAVFIVMIGGLACAPAGPSPKRLDGWVGISTRESVRQELGAPSLSMPLADGGAEWTYQYWSEAVIQDAAGPSNESCWEYVLVFDDQGILREWTRRRCGELGDPVERARERATGDPERRP